MRSYVAVGVAALAATVTNVNAATSADLCAEGSTDDNGNWYCQAVKAITYQNFGSSGSFNRVTNMDSSTGACSSTPQSYSGSLAPLNEEVSLHFRGPLNLKQLAVYKPKASNSKRDESAHERAHQHLKKHAANAHGHAHVHQEAKRDDPCNPASRAMVTATINGVVQSWLNDYFGPECAAATAAPSATSGNVLANIANAAVAAVTSAVAPAAKAPASGSVGNGDFVQAAYYNAESGKAHGLTFLNNLGGQGSGTWDSVFGNSLSYAGSDGASGAASSQILKDTTIDTHELVIMSDRSCDDGECGYSRPGTVAYHGFDGDEKVFLLEFGMPDNGQSGWLENMPAIWMLNAQIPRTLQYGNPQCSCWTTGCGEFDLFEVLAPGDKRCKSTIHGNVAGGDSNYFSRPTSGTMKAAVTMTNSAAHIKILDDDYEFGDSLSNSEVNALTLDTDSLDEALKMAVSLFTLG